MDFELMRAGFEQAVPFNQHLGLEILELAEGRGVVRLPDDDRVRNPVGSHHASALFAAGEAAAGATVMAAFVEHLEAVTPLPDGARITYHKIARGPITATAVLAAGATEILDEVHREGRAQFSIDVSLVDGAGEVVADMTVRRHILRDS
jgi:acyl-coenzyme A thioesterase PaaI-like protein